MAIIEGNILSYQKGDTYDTALIRKYSPFQ